MSSSSYRTLSLAVLVVALVVASMPFRALAQAPGHGHERDRAWPFYGSPLVHRALIRATAEQTGTPPRELAARLRGGASIGSIAGARRDAVLAAFDARVDAHFDRAVASGRLPASLANSRRVWFKREARLMIDQPGLRPAFPGLHELHTVVIRAAVQVTGAPRAEVKARLEACGTIADVARSHGKSASDVVAFALAGLGARLDAAVGAGKLAAAQRDSWHAALSESLNAMVTTPGLHVAGKTCAS